MTAMDAPTTHPSITRVRRGRLLAGVCAGLAERWEVPVVRVRAGFAIATPLLGLGALAYLVLWLLLPVRGDEAATAGTRGIVVLAAAAGAAVGLGALATGAAVAALVGLGWVVAVVAGAVVVGVLVSWPRLAPAWALLPVVALVAPSLVLAAAGVSVDPRTADRVVAPRTVADLPSGGLHSDLAPLLVDLRQTRLPARGIIHLRVRGGLRRTVVALPHDRCVRLSVTTHPQAFVLRALDAATASIGSGTAFVQGQVTSGGGTRREPAGRSRSGPTLELDLSSAGGALHVRDYPDDVDPLADPTWGDVVLAAEPRPVTEGLPRREARRELRAWGARRAAERPRLREQERRVAGPCAVGRADA